MWKIVDGRLIHTTDDSRTRYQLRISRVKLDGLKDLAKKHQTHVGYLLENGYKNLLKNKDILFDKKNRPKDKVALDTTCDKDLLDSLKEYAKESKLTLSDVAHASIDYIDLSEVKTGDWRYRVEK